MKTIRPDSPTFEVDFKDTEGWYVPRRASTKKKLHYKIKGRMEVLCGHIGILTLAKESQAFYDDDSKPDTKYCQRCIQALPAYRINGKPSRDYDVIPSLKEKTSFHTEPEPFQIRETHWLEARCAHMEDGKRCPETGIYPTYNPNSTRQHFCTRHNPRIVTA